MKTSESASAEIKLRARGQVTLPKALFKALHMEAGDSVRVVKIAHAIVLTPLRKDLEGPRQQILKMMKRRWVSAADLLRDL